MASDIENEKRSLRTAALAMRASLPPELRAEYSRAICRRLYEHPALSKAERVMLYAAAGTEPDLTGLAGLLSADGKRLYYPVCCAEGLMYAASPDKPDAWRTGKYGIAEPDPEHSSLISQWMPSQRNCAYTKKFKIKKVGVSDPPGYPNFLFSIMFTSDSVRRRASGCRA